VTEKGSRAGIEVEKETQIGIEIETNLGREKDTETKKVTGAEGPRLLDIGPEREEKTGTTTITKKGRAETISTDTGMQPVHMSKSVYRC